MTSSKRKTGKKEEVNDTLMLGHSEISFIVRYPDENPENFVEDITNTMDYLGLFDDLKKISSIVEIYPTLG